jgi:iron(III) transport system ATP-binding protein
MQNHVPAAVEFQSVMKRYGTTTAVHGVSFAVEPGTLATLLGPSGCGKTTTLRLIAGLETATAGRILIGGRDVTHLPASERNVSMVFQSYALFPHMTVLANVAYGPTVSGVAKRRAQDMAADKIALLGLAGLEDRFPSELSGGQQQRVAVARALVLEPLVLLFDEPLSNLDAKLRRRVRDDIRDLQSRLKLTVVYVTHDQQEALAISDQIIVMANARIAQSGRPRELYEMPANSFVADFIGEANIVDAELLAWSGGQARVQLGGLELMLPHCDVPPGPVKVAIRPEAVRLSREKPPDHALPARVTAAVYLGRHMEYTAECALGRLFVVDWATTDPHAIGCELWLRLANRGLMLLPDLNIETGRGC